MVHRLIDLVVLVAELSQQTDKSFKDLDKELVHRGYSEEEIEQALFWISSQWCPSERGAAASVAGPGVRILSPWESDRIEPAAYGYLLRLANLGIVDADQLDRILERVTPMVSGRVSVADVKEIAGALIFNLSGDDLDEDYIQELDEEIKST
jgi:Smg protein